MRGCGKEALEGQATCGAEPRCDFGNFGRPFEPPVPLRLVAGANVSPGEWIQNFDESQLDMIALALGVLLNQSPGFDYAVHEIARKLGGRVAMVEEFRRLRGVTAKCPNCGSPIRCSHCTEPL